MRSRTHMFIIDVIHGLGDDIRRIEQEDEH